MRDLLLKLCRREDLTVDEAAAAFDVLMDGRAGDAQIGGLLVGLAAKGTTVDELFGAAGVMRKHVIGIDVPPDVVVLDTCGTGGSRLRAAGLFNISTAAAVVVAACGQRVVKHGNRSASSRSGSADVLEHLGVSLDLTPADQRRCLDEVGICFAFARGHHPAMRHVAGARTALGIPTIFNLLGPLTNPAGARYQLLGVFAPELTGRLARVLQKLGSRRAWVVHAEAGLDELSTLGTTQISELRDGQVADWTLDPAALGLATARVQDLQADGVAGSARAIADVFAGKVGPKRDIVLLNAAAGLVITGRADDLPAALALAAGAVDDGRAGSTLAALTAFRPGCSVGQGDIT